MPPRHEPERHHVPTPADRSPYWGDEADPGRPDEWRDLARLEQQAGDALHANEDDTQACGQAYPDGEYDTDDVDTVIDPDAVLDLDELAAAFAADEGLTVVFRCQVCRTNPVDMLAGQRTCSWCASQDRP